MARAEPMSAAQRALLLRLAERLGLSTQYLDSAWTRAGLEADDCTGSVRGFLASLDREGANRLIEKLRREQQSDSSQSWTQDAPVWFVDTLRQASAASPSPPAREHVADLAGRGGVPGWFVQSQCDVIKQLYSGAAPSGRTEPPERATRRQRAVCRAVAMGAALAEATPERIEAWRQETGFPGATEIGARVVAAAYAAGRVAQRLHDRPARPQSPPRPPARLLRLVAPPREGAPSPAPRQIESRDSATPTPDGARPSEVDPGVDEDGDP